MSTSFSQRPLRVIPAALCMLVTSFSWGQVQCNCPAAGSCAPCAGGINSYTLVFNGGTSATITVKDNNSTEFSGTVAAGGTFTVTATDPNGKFQGPSVDVYVDAVLNTSISTNCNQVAIGDSLGSFTITGAASKSGGPICCAPSQIDHVVPVISNCPSNISTNAAPGACTAVANWTPPTANDNCSVATFTSDHSPGDTFTVGVTSVTYTATDNYGNQATCTFNVTISDVTPPSILNCPSDITVNAGASCSTAVTWMAPTANDNCSLASFTANHTPGDLFPLGVTVVTYTATDSGGKQATCSFNVTVNDNTPPTISNCPSNIIATADASCSATVTWMPPTAHDNCTLSSLTTSRPPGDVFAIGVSTVTYTAKDNAGNQSTCSFTVTVKSAPPSFSNCPASIVVSADANCHASVTWAPPSATGCSAVTVQSTHDPGSLFSMGTTNVVYTATDVTGVQATCTFAVVVQNVEEISMTGCPQNMQAQATESNEAIVTWVEPQFSIRCGNLTVAKSHESGSTFTTGSTDVTYTATSDDGKTKVCSFTVNVLPPEDQKVAISKAVTPNGDGVNDEWKIERSETYPNLQVVVFDRWGGIVFKSTGYQNSNPWKGTNLSGGNVPTGTYFYRVVDPANSINQTGSIEVVR